MWNFSKETWREESFGRRSRRCVENNLLDIKELSYKYVDSNRISQLRDKWQERNFGFNKLLVIYWLAKQLLASQEKYREYSD